MDGLHGGPLEAEDRAGVQVRGLQIAIAAVAGEATAALDASVTQLVLAAELRSVVGGAAAAPGHRLFFLISELLD